MSQSLTDDDRKKLRVLLISHEGFSQYPYEDSVQKKITIGYGRNLTDRGITSSEAMEMLNNDIEYFVDRLRNRFAFFDQLDEVRKIVLIDMCFNLGINGLLGFVNMLLAIEKHDYKQAAVEMLASEWAKQVKGRARQLANMMMSGKITGVE